MNRRKLLCILLIALLCALTLSTASGDALLEPTDADFPKEEALSIASAQTAVLLGISEKTLSEMQTRAHLVRLDVRPDPCTAWVITYFGNHEMNSVPDALAIISSPEGEILASERVLYAGYGEAFGVCATALYGDAAADEPWALAEWVVYDALFNNLGNQTAFPRQLDLPEEDAIFIAQETLMAEYRLTQSEVEALDVNPLFMLQQDTSLREWVIIFSPPGERTMEYQVTLSALSGKVRLVYSIYDKTNG